MINKTSDKNVGSIEDDVMSQEAFNELIDNFEVVATLTMYGRKSIKHYVKKMQAEREQNKKRIKELEEENAMLKKADNIARDVNIEEVTEVMNKSYEEFMSNYINKQKVIDVIKNYISREEIEKALEVCEKVYEKEMKPYQREYGLDVTYLSKKEKAELVNKRNCLITQMETYKQLLGGNKQ